MHSLQSAYADDATFFVSDGDSVMEVMNTFDKFSFLSGLKPNKTKYETVGIVALRGLSLAPSGMDCIDLTQKGAAH